MDECNIYVLVINCFGFFFLWNVNIYMYDFYDFYFWDDIKIDFLKKICFYLYVYYVII